MPGIVNEFIKKRRSRLAVLLVSVYVGLFIKDLFLGRGCITRACSSEEYQCYVNVGMRKRT